MSNWWEILEIPKESDKQTIKKAYARLLKKYHPEVDPEGYQKLREAYTQALKQCTISPVNGKIKNPPEIQIDKEIQSKEEAQSKEKAKPREEDQSREEDQFREEDQSREEAKSKEEAKPREGAKPKEESHPKEETQPLSKNTLRHTPIVKWQNEIDMMPLRAAEAPSKDNAFAKVEQEANAFMEEVKVLYEDLKQRDEEAAWRKLLNSPILWELDTAQVIKEKLFAFLKDHYYLHSHIWELLEEQFQWNLESTTPSQSRDVKAQRILRLLQSKEQLILKEIKIPHYRYLEGMPEELLSDYIEQRERGYYLLIGNKVKEAYTVLLDIYKRFDEDPELMRLMGECCLVLEEYDLAIAYFCEACRKNPRDRKSMMMAGGLLTWVKGECQEAIKYFNLYNEFNGEDELTINGLGYCYYHTGDWAKAKFYIEKLLLTRDNKAIRKYLASANAHLAGKRRRILKKSFLGKKKK